MDSHHKDFKISQQAIIRNSVGRILILREPTMDSWLLPGGRIEPSDAGWLEALKREVREEISCEIRVMHPLAVDMSDSGKTYAIAFLCEAENMETLSLSDEHAEYKWIEPADSEEYLYYKNIAAVIAEQLR